jgi:ribosomal protein L11
MDGCGYANARQWKSIGLARRHGARGEVPRANFMTAFGATIRIRGINPYVLVSAVRAKTIRSGWRKPMPVRVRVNGKPERQWRINMMPVGNGAFYLYLHASVRKASPTSVGDRVQVDVEFDSSYRNGPQHSMPAWFRRELKANPKAKRNWLGLTPSRKKEILRNFARLKSPETQARNLAGAMHVLSGAAGRFMGRAWTDGS